MIPVKEMVAVLPAGKVFDPVFQAISEAAAQAHLPCERLSLGPALQSGALCASLEKTDLVIADLTARNPSVMYLVGYAHALGKRLVLLATHREDCPFDEKRHEVLVYARKPEFLKDELLRIIRGDAPQVPGEAEGNPRVEFMELFGDLLQQHQHVHRGDVIKENPKTFILLNQDMELALVQDLARKARELGLRIKLM